MQSVTHLIASVFSGTILVLASHMLASPLLAVLVAAACVTGAWLGFSRGYPTRSGIGVQRRHGDKPGMDGLDRSTLG